MTEDWIIEPWRRQRWQFVGGLSADARGATREHGDGDSGGYEHS